MNIKSFLNATSNGVTARKDLYKHTENLYEAGVVCVTEALSKGSTLH